MREPSSGHTLLICTVGGSPAPIVKSIAHWQPVKIWFLPTGQTKRCIEHETVDQQGRPVMSIVDAAKASDFLLDPGRYDVHEMRDGEDLGLCIEDLHRLSTDVEKWVARGEGFRVVVDFTGGTKCMSAAVGLQARRWPCTFSYVGGTQRTNDGVGTVETGHERVVYQANPWDALGYQAVEDFVVLFNQHAYSAGLEVADTAGRRMSRSDRKPELACLVQLAKGLDAWDRFDHGAARSALDNVVKSANHLRAALGGVRAGRVLEGAQTLIKHLDELKSAQTPSRPYVLDLLANAHRRRHEGRHDDAVARLYRAIEAIAQVRLKEAHGIPDTGEVRVEQLPEELQREWGPHANEGALKLGLQDDYRLLSTLGDALGETFRKAELHNRERSPLVSRNQSILAHGFNPVSVKVSDQLWKAALALAGLEEEALPSFPAISAGGV